MYKGPEDKLLALRKKYKITQQELVKDSISRVYLGMIETKKRALTRNTAKILIKNLNSILKERGERLPKSIDEMTDEIMESKMEQAERNLNKLLEKKERLNFDDLWYISDARFELPREISKEYCEKFYEKLKDEKLFEEAKTYLVKSFFGKIDKSTLLHRMEDLFILGEKTNDLIRAITIYEKFCDYINENLISHKREKLNFLYAHALYTTGKYEKALNALNNISPNSEFEIDIDKLKANIYLCQKEYKLAIDEYIKLTKNQNFYIKCLAYSSILQICIEQNFDDILIKFYNNCKIIFVNYEYHLNFENFKILRSLFETAIYLNKTQEAKKYAHEALLIGKLLKSKENERVNILAGLVAICDENDLAKIECIEIEYSTLIKNTQNYKCALEILDYYRKYYPKQLNRKFSLFV